MMGSKYYKVVMCTKREGQLTSKCPVPLSHFRTNPQLKKYFNHRILFWAKMFVGPIRFQLIIERSSDHISHIDSRIYEHNNDA